MKTNSHTPAPWAIDSDGDGKPHAIVTSTHDKNGPDDDVCEVYGGNADDDSVRLANARLIAAAPDLLAACKTALARYEAEEETSRERGEDAAAGMYAKEAAQLRAALAAAQP